MDDDHQQAVITSAVRARPVLGAAIHAGAVTAQRFTGNYLARGGHKPPRQLSPVPRDATIDEGNPVIWKLVVVAFVVTVAIADVRWRKIPRALTLPAFFAGLLYHGATGQFWNALGAAALGFAIGMALFTLGAVAGGDVKLLAALGALLGFSVWTNAMELTIFAAGAVAAVQIVRHHAVRQTWRNLREIVQALFHRGFQEHPVVNVRNPATLRSPFGLAAAIGTVIAVLR